MSAIQPRCPYCLADLLAHEPRVRCGGCRTPHHRVCFEEHEGCVAYGCGSAQPVRSNDSIFLRDQVTVRGRMQQHALGPFVLTCTVLPRVPEERPREERSALYARLELEEGEVREDGFVRGRGVVYTPSELSFRRIDLQLSQGIKARARVARVTLIEPEEGRPLLPGSYPFELELAAPPVTAPVDPFLLEIALVRGAFGQARSPALHLFLLPRRVAPELEPEDPSPLGAAIRLRPRPPRAHGASPDPFAPDPFAPDPFTPDPFAPDPSAPAGPGPAAPGSPVAGPSAPDRFAPNLAAVRAHEGRAPASREAADPPQPPGEVDGWRLLRGRAIRPATPEATSVARGRVVPSPRAPRQVQLEAPARAGTPEVLLRVHCGLPLRWLQLALQYELVRPGGRELPRPGYPALEELDLVAGEGLAPPGGGEGVALEVALTLPAAHQAALAEVRATGAGNAALRLHVAADAIDAQGSAVRVRPRSITFA